MNRHIPLVPGKMYHLVSHAVGDENLFRSDENYRFFLSRYRFYIEPIAETLSFCLMPNHFHFMVRIRQPEEILAHFYQVKPGKLFDPEKVSDFIMERFSNLLNSYSKSYNKVYARRGALFVDYMSRTEICDEKQFLATVSYIHRNPVHHGFTDNMEDWKWSSYQAIKKSELSTAISRDEILRFFEGVESFVAFHKQLPPPNSEWYLD